MICSNIVERLPLIDRDRPTGLVVVAAGDDRFGIGDDRAVVEEDVHVVVVIQEG
jgi:hypothetical protein